MTKFFLAIALLLTNAIFAQTKVPILIISNANGNLYIDGEDTKSSVTKDIAYKTTVSLGEHLIQVSSNGVVMSETINCTDGNQKIVRINFTSSNTQNSEQPNTASPKSNLRLIKITDETVTVNSTSNLSGNSKNLTEIDIPQKTKAYIYRVSIYPRGQYSNENSLVSLLSSMDPDELALTNSFGQFAIKNSGYNIDAYIFNNSSDASNFLKGKTFYACKSFTNKSNFCYSENTCLGNRIYVGLNNNSLMQGLDVRIEVVAIVDNSSDATSTYSYNVENPTNTGVNFSISTDNTNWTNHSVSSRKSLTFKLNQGHCFLKIQTSLFKTVNYKIYSGRKYKVYWNETQQKWDLGEG